MSAEEQYHWLKTDAWQLQVPEGLSQESPLLVIPTVHPRGDRRIIRCAQVALDAGFRIHFIWLGDGEPSQHKFVQESLLEAPASRWERLSRVRRVAAIARQLNGDAWHIHDFYLLPSTRRWSKQSNRRALYDVHEYYADYYSSLLRLPEPIRKFVARRIENFQVKSAKTIGAANVVTEKMAVPFRARGVDTAVSPNYPLLRDFAAAPQVPFKERRWQVLHIGTLTPGYGTHLLILLAQRALDRDLPFEFQAVSRFPSREQRDMFETLLGNYGRPKNLRLVDTRHTHEMPGLIAQAGFGLSLLSPGGQNDVAVPSKIYEHVMLGLVNVVTNRPGQRKFTQEHAVGILGHEDSPDLILDQMLKFANAPEQTEKELLQHAEMARNKFTWERGVAPGLHEILQRLEH